MAVSSFSAFSPPIMNLPIAKQLWEKSKRLEVTFPEPFRWRSKIPTKEWQAIFQYVMDTYDDPNLPQSIEHTVDAYETKSDESISTSSVSIKMDNKEYLIHSTFPKSSVVSMYSFKGGMLTKMKWT